MVEDLERQLAAGGVDCVIDDSGPSLAELPQEIEGPEGATGVKGNSQGPPKVPRDLWQAA
ncbi:MAG: hypothetical protein JKY65_09600 [Planctomycetes bacterium]|nr:hypothetical protein [Planctomycetota bacterium]